MATMVSRFTSPKRGESTSEVRLLELFENTKRAFIETDLDMANLAWDYHKKIGKGCDEIVQKVAHCDLNVNEAVCFALIARYFKRITSHLTNIATSVVLPLSDLDFFDEKRLSGTIALKYLCR